MLLPRPGLGNPWAARIALTQAEVARHFERPQSFASQCESGERRVDPTELRKFAEIYHQPATYFLDDG